jgi:hypothetical protein
MSVTLAVEQTPLQIARPLYLEFGFMEKLLRGGQTAAPLFLGGKWIGS